MADEWRVATVKAIASSQRNALVGGPFGSNLVSRDYVSCGVPVIRGQNMGGRWIGGEFVYVTPEKARTLEANLARPGDIVFTQRGTLGQVSLVPHGRHDTYVVSQSQMKLTVDISIANAMFYYYVFASPQYQIYTQQHAIQTGVPHTNLGILRDTPIPIPPRFEQDFIAHTLGSLDDKIELNRRTSETLEAMARALFKNWFIDFDPVRAKAEGRKPTGIDESIAKLFPDSFEESDLGPIPQGWKTLPLRQLAEMTSGGTPSKKNPEYWTGDIPWVSPKSMMSIHVHNSDERVSVSAIGNGTRLVPEGAVLVMVRGMGLHQGIRISQAQRDVTFNQDVKALIPKAVGGSFLLYAMLDSGDYLFSKVQASGHGTGVIPTDILEGLMFAVPPEVACSELTKPLDSYNSMISALTLQSGALASLRDTLLPKLLSGELRIKDAERFVEAAL